MFVHINPMVNAIGETVSTLKFAERVASIDLGAARSNKESGEIREFKDEVSSSLITYLLSESIRFLLVTKTYSFLVCIRSQTSSSHWRKRMLNYSN